MIGWSVCNDLKGCGRKRPWVNLRNYYRIYMKASKNTIKKWAELIGVLAKNRIHHLPNTSHKHYENWPGETKKDHEKLHSWWWVTQPRFETNALRRQAWKTAATSTRWAWNGQQPRAGYEAGAFRSPSPHRTALTKQFQSEKSEQFTQWHWFLSPCYRTNDCLFQACTVCRHARVTNELPLLSG
jgi:hypothetical protein